MKTCQNYLKGPLHAVICPYLVFVSLLIRRYNHIKVLGLNGLCLKKKTLLLIFHMVKAEETHSPSKSRISFPTQKLLRSL